MYRVEIRPLGELRPTIITQPSYLPRTEHYTFSQHDDAAAFALALRERVTLAAVNADTPINQTVVLWQIDDDNVNAQPIVLAYT